MNLFGERKWISVEPDLEYTKLLFFFTKKNELVRWLQW